MIGPVPPAIPGDGLRFGALLLSSLVLLGGLAVLAVRIGAAWRGGEVSRNLAAFRMIAVLGALGGFLAYLRDPARPEARWALVLGGLSAAPWVALVGLEAVRRFTQPARKPRDPRSG